MKVHDKLVLGNQTFKQYNLSDEIRKLKVSQLVNGQNPYALVITCSDSRVVPEKILNCDLGDIFVIRTAGNVINEGELASIEYGIEHLHIQYILVLAHTHCGAIHVAIHHEKGRFLSPILDNITRCIDGECDERKASIKNALKQVEYIKSKFPEYQGEVKAALYDIETLDVIF